MALGVLISSFTYIGVPPVDTVFGAFTASSSAQIQRIQLSAQVAPSGGDLQITLVDQDETSLGAIAVLTAALFYSDTLLATPITLFPGSVVRAKVTAVDGGVAENITVNLIGATEQGGPDNCCTTHECQPPQMGIMFFPGTAGPIGPVGPIGPTGPEGPIGPAGPIGSFEGNFVSSNTYYDNAERRSIVAYAGSYWIADEPVKDGTNTWENPNVNDWAPFGASLSNVATSLALIGDQSIAVEVTIDSPGLLQSSNYVDGVTGWLLTAAGNIQALDDNNSISGKFSTSSPKFNPASLTRTMPAVGFAQLNVGVIADGDIPINPLINNVTGDELIFFGWLQGTNAFLENRFGNTSQKFVITVQGVGQNNSAGSDFLYIQLYYRTRTGGGGWGAWTLIIGDAYMQKLALLDQSYQNTQVFSVGLIGTNDIQFSAGFSKGAAGTASIGGGEISVLALN